MSEYTKGPWMYGKASNYGGFYIAPLGTLPTLAGVERCGDAINVHVFNFPGNCEANARLIAAAPELLEALEDIIDSQLLVGLTELHNKVRDKAYAAIAKAKGES